MLREEGNTMQQFEKDIRRELSEQFEALKKLSDSEITQTKETFKVPVY